MSPSRDMFVNDMQLINKDVRIKLTILKIYVDAKLTESQSQKRLKKAKVEEKQKHASWSSF